MADSIDKVEASFVPPVPCPSCGVQPCIKKGTAGWWRVGCINESCRMRPKAESWISREDAIRHWNKRPLEDALREEIAELKKALEAGGAQIVTVSEPVVKTETTVGETPDPLRYCAKCGSEMEQIRYGKYQCKVCWD